MNRGEARKIAMTRADELEETLRNSSQHIEQILPSEETAVGKSGVEYKVVFDWFWEDKKDHIARVVVMVDDGSFSTAAFPVTVGFPVAGTSNAHDD